MKRCKDYRARRWQVLFSKLFGKRLIVTDLSAPGGDKCVKLTCYKLRGKIIVTKIEELK